MADYKEKNLLNEIAYLTRLIGQHKNGQASMNRKWESNMVCRSPTLTFQNQKVHSNIKSRRPVGLDSYKFVQTGFKQRSSPYVKVAANHKKSITEHGEQKFNINAHQKFSNGLVEDRQVNVNPALSTQLLRPQGSNVHVNPNFCGESLAKTTKVHINPNFNNLAKNEVGRGVPCSAASNASPKEEQKLKVHVNPKFCKLLPDNSPHTQLRTLMSKNVHVNPKLVERVLKEKNESGTVGPKKSGNAPSTLPQMPSVSALHNNVPENNYVPGVNFGEQKADKAGLDPMQCSSRKGEFMTLGKRKLVRIGHRPNKSDNEMKCKEKPKMLRNNISSSKQKCLMVISPSRSLKKAKSITSKYKLIKLGSAIPIASGEVCISNKYKIDRRSVVVRNTSQNYCLRNNLKDTSMLRLKKSVKLPHRQRRFSISSSRTSNGNLVWRRSWSLQAKEFKTTNTKLYRIGSSPIIKKNNDMRTKNARLCNSTLVRIGGVLYKSSRNKLTRSQGPNIRAKRQDCPVTLKKKGKVVTRRQVLLIRGQKFVMDPQGKTLRRLSSSSSTENKQTTSPSYSLRRVDIGGVTFVEKSSNVLMRTDTHKARTLLSYAKQKSIATLMKKLKKNNQPCIFFQKFGRCLRMEKGTCPCVHDRKHVAVCKRFLQAKCSVDGCLLSHDVVPEKMPTCKYFLEGCCNRVDCPYLHVKVNAKADICTSFLQGYCSNGEKCKKRHVRICPDFEKKGRCLKGKNCPYPHVNGRAKRSYTKKRAATVPAAAKVTPNVKKHSLELKKANTHQNKKVELKRYYLAPEEAVKLSSSEGTSDGKESVEKESTDKINIPCLSEVSKTCDNLSVVDVTEVKNTTYKGNQQRKRIGSLPSFIPL